jgi:hypothetical protein
MDADLFASPRWIRLWWTVIGGAGVGVLAVARWLTPDPSGMGTHMQIGLPPCGFLYLTKLPCPTCGLTTSFAHMARLQFTSALHAHWLGPLLFVLTAVTIAISASACATRTPPAHIMKRLRVARLLVIIAAAALVVWMVRVAAIVLG